MIAHTPAVELLLNGKSLGKVATPKSGYIFAFKDIQWGNGTPAARQFQRGQRKTCRYRIDNYAGPHSESS